MLQEKLKGAQSSEAVKPWVPRTWFLLVCIHVSALFILYYS